MGCYKAYQYDFDRQKDSKIGNFSYLSNEDVNNSTVHIFII